MEEHSLKVPVELDSVIRVSKLPLQIISFLLVSLYPLGRECQTYRNLTISPYPISTIWNVLVIMRIWYCERALGC